MWKYAHSLGLMRWSSENGHPRLRGRLKEREVKTPIAYYGGKQFILPYILPRLWKERTLYCEPFFGGGAVFFGKEQDSNEVINDKNDRVVNFYRCVKDPEKCKALLLMADQSLYAQSLYNKARAIWRGEVDTSDVEAAWAFWFLSVVCFQHIIGASFGIEKNTRSKHTQEIIVKKQLLHEAADRFERTQIMCMDAVECIKKFDTEGSFFYVDPPYVGADQGHYKGYTQDDFDALLECLASIKGKFLLSSYENDKLTKMTKTHGWYTERIKSYTSYMNTGKQEHKLRTELLTANYDIEMGNELFKEAV